MARQPHPDAEQLAEYADRRLDAVARAAIEQHLAECGECRHVLAGTVELLADERRTRPQASPRSRLTLVRRRRTLVAAAAGLAAAAALVFAIRTPPSGRTSGEFRDLVAAVASETTRPLEGRLVGFPPAPPPEVTRARSDREIAPAIRIAAAAVERQVRRDGAETSRAELGVAYAVVGDLENAVKVLESAATGPDAASALSDLAAVYLRRGRATNRPEDYELARDAAQRALAAMPSSPEACFNHALALEYLSRGEDAQVAWRRCLSIESDAVWSAEIRTHLAASP
jgi:tetratricopeptide (TPR) repeat protein